MEWLEDSLDEQRRRTRQAMVLSLLVHLCLASLMMLAPSPEPLVLPPAITVDLVAAVPAPPASTPAPKAAPKPAPPPPPPKPAVKVLPKYAPEPTPKPRPAPKPVEREVIHRRERRDISYDDAMSELRQELGDSSPLIAPEPAPQQTAQAAPRLQGTSSGTRKATEFDVWALSVKRHIRQKYVVPGDFRTRSLATMVEIQVDASGEVIGVPKVVRSSGDPYYDDNTIRTIRKSSPLPEPPKAGRYQVIFPSNEQG